MSTSGTPSMRCGPRLYLSAIPDIPIAETGDDVAKLVDAALAKADMKLHGDDVLVITSKLISRAEGCFVDLSRIEVSTEAEELAREVNKDPALVQLILKESTHVSRKAEGILIVRHRLGFISANAGIDQSNARPANATEESGPWALTLPRDPDASAARVREYLQDRHDVSLGVLISDSHGRPFRFGSVGVAIGAAGLPVLHDHNGTADLFGRVLEATSTATADQLCAAADLVAGQSQEGHPVILARGLHFDPSAGNAQQLLRPADGDLYA